MTAAKAPPSSSRAAASFASLLQSSNICFASSSEQEVASSTVCRSFAEGPSALPAPPLLFELMAGLHCHCVPAQYDRLCRRLGGRVVVVVFETFSLWEFDFCRSLMAAVLPPRFDMDQHYFGPTQYVQAPAALPPHRFFNAGPGPAQGRTYDSAPPVHAAGRQQNAQQKRKRAGKRFGNASKRRRGGGQQGSLSQSGSFQPRVSQNKWIGLRPRRARTERAGRHLPAAARAETPSTIPRTTPRAPFNSSSYLMQRAPPPSPSPPSLPACPRHHAAFAF